MSPRVDSSEEVTSAPNGSRMEEDDVSGPDSMLVISALGRPLEPGMLYNARNDEPIPGIDLWRTEDITGNMRIRPQPNTRFQVSASESLSEKMKLLDVSASVKASFFSGLVEVGGSGKYLKEETSSTRQCSVSLRYHVTTEVREVMLSQLPVPNPEILGNTDATHVVSQVIYGADALMEFQETASSESSKQEIEGNLNVMINKIPFIKISGEGSLNMADEDKEKVKGFKCKFYGDFYLTDLPTTYEEAVKVYKELPKLLGENGEKAVPVKVWLYPLSKLTDTESKLKIMISETLVSAVEKAMDDFHQAEIRTNDLLERSREIRAKDIVTKLVQFQSSLRVFTTEFLKKMAELIPAIRGGDQGETKLGDLLKSQDASGFSEKEMEKWLDDKETETNVVTKYIKKIKNYPIERPGSELNSFLMDPDVSDALVFSFTSLSYEEPYLMRISKAAENIQSGSTISTTEQAPTEEVPWYKRPKIWKILHSAISVFSEVPGPIGKVISFIPDSAHPGASVRWYRHAQLRNPHVTHRAQPFSCELTLDPNTAGRHILLSEGNRKATGVNEDQRYPDHPDRFTSPLHVLSKEPLPGRYSYWESEWTGSNVEVGVAYRSISRGDYIRNSYKAWEVDCYGGSYYAHHNGQVTLLPVSPSGSRRVGVYVDREASTLSFYRVSSDTLTLLYTFHTTFMDEPLHAAFWVASGSSVSLV